MTLAMKKNRQNTAKTDYNDPGCNKHTAKGIHPVTHHKIKSCKVTGIIDCL